MDRILELSPQDLERFWSKVILKANLNACWIWTGTLDYKKRYGRFTLNGRSERAHVVAYILQKGQPSFQINHTCDNKLCMNGAHLYDGDQLDNEKDKIVRNRQPERYRNLTHNRWGQSINHKDGKRQNGI